LPEQKSPGKIAFLPPLTVAVAFLQLFEIKGAIWEASEPVCKAQSKQNLPASIGTPGEGL
jgi:hypothetical protein